MFVRFFHNRSRSYNVNRFYKLNKFINIRNTYSSETFSDGKGFEVSFNKYGEMAQGSVVCMKNGALIHSTICSSYLSDPEVDSLPLNVDYKDKYYSRGKIPGTSMRREKHGSEEEILVARAIDRAVRPLFPPGYNRDIHLSITAHSLDNVADPVVMAVNATSCSLLSSRLEWNGPIGCARVALVDGELIVNPTVPELNRSPLNLLYAGSEHGTLMLVHSNVLLRELTTYTFLPHPDVSRLLSGSK